MLSTKAKEAMGPLFPMANQLRMRWLRAKYNGEGVYCVCCSSNFKMFAPFGSTRRNNAWCPKCESLERHRLLWKYMEDRTNLYKEKVRLLHVAPETIFWSHFKKQPNIEYHPVDKFPHMYPAGTEYLNLLQIDIEDDHFDAIICNHVFQYIEEDGLAMRELYRVLKKGGWAILQVPIDKSLTKTFEDASVVDPLAREKAFGLKDHVRFYAMDYIDRLRCAGFTVKVDDYTSCFSDAENFRYGFWKGDPVFYCTKE